MDRLDREIKGIIDLVMTRMINRNAIGTWSHCICGCNRRFRQRSKYHQFYSRACYSRTHRIPGFVRRIVNSSD